MHIDFIAGVIESDGGLSISIENKAGRFFTCELKVESNLALKSKLHIAPKISCFSQRNKEILFMRSRIYKHNCATMEMPIELGASWFSPKCVEAQRLMFCAV